MSGYLGCQLHHSTAYHPQAQGRIERLNRILKFSLKFFENPSEWYDQLPWVSLALPNSTKEDLAHQSTNFFVFGQSTRLPGEFFETTVSDFQDPTSNFAHRLAQHFSTLTYQPPRHVNPKSFLEKLLLAPQISHVYARIDSYKPPLRPVYKGPFLVLEKYNKYFVLDLLTGTDHVSVDRLKVARLNVDTLNQSLFSHRTNSPGFNSLVGSRRDILLLRSQRYIRNHLLLLRQQALTKPSF